MVREFHAEDRGKKVMTADGEMVGTIENVEGSTAHVKPDAGLAQGTRRKLGWTKSGEATYQLRHGNVEAISDDEVHLKSDF
jgi:sporulation protein YlmC with PRC-barrel domain